MIYLNDMRFYNPKCFSIDVYFYKMLASHTIVLGIIQLQNNKWTEGKKNIYFVKRQKDKWSNNKRDWWWHTGSKCQAKVVFWLETNKPLTSFLLLGFSPSYLFCLIKKILRIMATKVIANSIKK